VEVGNYTKFTNTHTGPQLFRASPLVDNINFDYCFDYYGDYSYWGFTDAENYDTAEWIAKTSDPVLYYENSDPDWGYECFPMNSAYVDTDLVYQDF
jgi:hypothetical protein